MTTQARWAARIVGGLIAGGVRHVVVSPGSRSTPFLLAVLGREELVVHDVVDERSAAFFALGIARVTGAPPLLLCTSGTAAGHYLPAVMEASAAHLPLLLLTADRPPELHDLGVNQTTDQQHLFGAHARAFFELGAAAESDEALRGTETRAFVAATRARHPRPGPVHLNARARKPLEGQATPHVTSARVFLPSAQPDPEGVAWVAARLGGARRPAIAVGPGPVHRRALRPALRRLASALGAPVLADATSQVRFTGEGWALPRGALALRTEAGRRRLDADLVLEVGAAPIDAGYAAWAQARPRVVISDGALVDPSASAEAFVVGDLRAILEGLIPAQPREPWWQAPPPLPTPRALGPGAIAGAVVRGAPEGSLLFVGNSLAARAIDLHVSEDRDLAVLHQRGLSGIDGLVAGAAGAAHASGRPVTLLLGDVSLLHDLGSLATVGRPAAPFRVVVVNDDGGRIFEQLPIHARLAGEPFERHFAMAHGRTFRDAARLFGLDYERAETADGVEAALQGDGAKIVEVRLDPAAARRELADAIAAAEERWR